ncbi:uncharacterized protein PsGEF isoform X2 [Tribolium castaneum]|uniref:uncharacterized protein PsGEF isoform X2 n=1 Tax=Tribolium castaneum TaxID=7070 RepID=UPI00046C35B8|nr:PREDICTED: uncharacterized protein LOC663795 isoform X1 [Tribolium castaneum]|eukprot:XP_008201022.1 PREDICTED: uncharacterized protein LOC663795 isoform X1 [Tribolium castaneum]
MLKWTVMARREADKSDALRRPTADASTSETTPKSNKTKRRHSSGHRRSGGRRSSLGLEMDKENQFTSTPIKSFEDHHQFDALRDVSNLTPNRRVLSAKKCRRSASPSSHRKHKKKKLCLNPSHRKEFGEGKNYFRPFETVDSHIEGVLVDKDLSGELRVKRRIQDTYAPTLPTFTTEYSPCFMRDAHCLYNFTPAKATPLGKYLALDQDTPHPSKKPKIDHVSDFLHQINFITSPEDDKLTCPTMESKSTLTLREESKVSPLVKKLVDLRFSQLSCDKDTCKNNSSLINDLSLDQIVDAILNSSAESAANKENESNETHEENLINTENERHVATSFDRCSSDSGFKSSTTEYSHQLEGNFQCKCKTSTPNAALCDKTIININETFNERCVDVINPRKRPSSTPNDDNNAKRAYLDKSEEDNVYCTLKRQRCIRRRRTDDEKKMSAKKSRKVDEPIIGDESFDSNISGKIAEDNSTPLNETFTLLTPVDNSRRFRRCLLFESPTSLSESASTTNSSLRDVRGTMDLNIRCENDELYANIIRCKDLYRPNGKQINAYVKVALSDRLGDNRRKRNGILQRTAVQADSSKPFFNHTFKFPLQKESLQKRLHIEVWHRDRSSRTSEFLGCMSFDVRHVYTKDISGSYRLLPQSSGRCQNIPISVEPLDREAEEDCQPIMCESQSSVDEIMSLDGLDNDLKKATNKAILSEQQKYADENLFLRYLELDPTEGPEAIPAAMQRKATGNKNGRTPFTQTKKLTRAPKSGFGFSVVWTHPPRIERVEKGLPAEKAGILPGDYIIFVDKHNVVMMPEIDILNLIRSYGSQLTLEIFRRNAAKNGSVPSVRRLNSTGTCSTTGLPISSNLVQRRPSTVCSTNTASVDYNRRKLHLPQVTFSAEKASNNQEENRTKAMYQLIHKEQQYATGLQFAVTRFVSALAERRDLITPSEHKILFQNSEEILRVTEDILDNLVHEEGVHNLIRTYHAKLNEITAAYRRYCSGIKKADCVLANKTKNSNSEFVRFLHTPSIPRRRPDITAFIHKPLEHYREVLKAFTVIQSHTKPNHEDYPVINQLVHDLQHTYREITVEAGLMEPMGEGRPLLSVQDLENRLVFTKCKPFVLNKPGRQWIFGGDLGRVEGRNVRQYWTLLFSDLLLFAKVSRDRVLFIIEDPLPLAHITDMFFNVRKKDTEFRITVTPGGRLASSPTVHCGPDLSRTPKKNTGKRTVILRAPTTELKAVWQNLLQRQIFHVNAGMDGSSFSSPLESPDAPITSSVATLQSAESLSFRRQTPQNINENSEMQKQIDALIEHKCKQLSKNNSGKGNAIHLEKWMKGHLDSDIADEAELEPLSEEWTEEMLRKRSEELQLIDAQGNVTSRNDTRRIESRCEDNNLSDHDQSPSKSTTTESQVTVRSSPLVPETVPVCRQCHKNCLPSVNNSVKSARSNNNTENPKKDENDNKDEDDWRPLLLMGLSAINPAASLVKLDPFSTPIPQINVAPPTPESSTKTGSTSDQKQKDGSCSCRNSRPELNNLELSNEVDISPDDSPQTEEHPYHSLSSSNLTLRRYGTVSSLERLGTDEHEDNWDERYSSDEENEERGGIDNEAFYHSSIKSWTAKAGSFVAEKMSFFERLGEDYRSTGRFFERYLKTAETTVNGDDVQEDETSGATSGEEIWGTPTSGGEMEDPLSSPNYEGKQSPYDGSISSDNGDDTELMMDELLMTPPITGAIMRGLLPRRTLEPLIEEDFSESCSPSSSGTPTEPSMSPEQGNGTGDVADKCSTAVENRIETPEMGSAVTTSEATAVPKIHRSESYRKIVEAAEEDYDDALGFFDRFKPTVKFINIERVPRAKSAKIFEFFNMRRERRIHQTIPEGKQLIKIFSKEGTISDNVPTSYAEKPLSPRRLKDKQMDRRFWKQLSRRRGNKMSNLPA